MANKLYTEEQVRKILKSTHIYTDNDVDMILPQFTSIELPSDKEIESATNDAMFQSDLDEVVVGFRNGAKWLRDKILNQNNKQ